MKIAITNGLLINPSENAPRSSSIYIAAGKIIAHDHAPENFTPDITLDAQGNWICPGLIDLSAHPGEPGFTHKTTIAHEAHAAVQRGITTLCYPPNTSPVIDSAEIVEAIHQRAQKNQLARIVTLGALTKELASTQLSPMAALKQAGCVGVSNAKQPITDTRILYNALEYAATFDLTVFLFATDAFLTQGGCVHEGTISMRLGLAGIPHCAETIAVARALALQKATGARLHLCRLSCAESVELVQQAQRNGQSVTADVAIHQLFLTELDVEGFNTACHVQPPLRTFGDQQGLIAGIESGVITAICSDHEPHESAAKLQPFPSSIPGISGTDTLLSLTLSLTHKLKLTPNQLISLVTAKPAQILGLPQGTLDINSPADICIVDPEMRWTLTKENMLSRGKNSPFIGWPLQGEVHATVVAGTLRFLSNNTQSV
ncbi:MAG: dihydroorotase [Gammaproteobacteria bacterium]